jgi:hypothetical protein
MSGLPHSTNPIAIAKETVAISKQVVSPAFQKAAKWTLIISAAVTAGVGLVHAIKTMARDLTRKPETRDHQRNHAKPEPLAAGNATEETPPLRRDSGQGVQTPTIPTSSDTRASSDTHDPPSSDTHDLRDPRSSDTQGFRHPQGFRHEWHGVRPAHSALRHRPRRSHVQLRGAPAIGRGSAIS